MKKILCIVLVLLSISFCSCSGSGTNNNQKPIENTIKNNGGKGEATVSSEEYGVDEEDIKITPYAYYSSTNNGYLALVFYNTSTKTCGLDVNVTFFDYKNKKLDDSHDSIRAFPAGSSTVLIFNCFKGKFKKYKYEIETQDNSKSYVPITQNLQTTVKLNKEKISLNSDKTTAVVNVKNNGKAIDDTIKVHFLFFKGNKLVDTNNRYIYDSINPKKSAKVEAISYENCDSVKVYLDGYGYKK